MFDKTRKMALALLLGAFGCSDDVKDAAASLPLFAVPPKVIPVGGDGARPAGDWMVVYNDRMCSAQRRHRTLERCREPGN